MLPAFVDHHVHVGLIDSARLPANGIAGVVDLGWSDDIAKAADAGGASTGRLDVVFAGRFLTAPGGYPSDRQWAPEGSCRSVASPDDAAAAVAEQVELGASVIKVTLNAEAGPVLDDARLAAIVDAAHDAGRPVVAHAQGAGMVERSLAAGVDVLAHTPWTHRLDDGVIAEAASRQSWISTLDIHGYGVPSADRDRALDNLRRFHAAGGVVLYGTDLGNGPLPTSLNLRELAALAEAGLDDEEVLAALTAPWPLETGRPDLVTFVPGQRGSGPLAEWLTGARAVPADEIEVDP